MNRSLSLCALALLASSAYAQSFIADPASGSEVESLPYVTLKIDGGYDAFEIQMSDAVSFNYNGNPYCGIKASGNDTNIVVTPAREISDPGTYELVFGEYSLIWYKFHEDEDAEIYMNEEPIVLTYTIPGVAVPPISYDVTPASGTLPELTEVTLALNNDDFIDIDVQIADDIKIYRDGEVFSGLKATDKDTEVTFSLLTPATEEGIYEFVAAPGSLVFYTPDYTPAINEEIRISYRVHTAESVAYDVTPTGYKPADNSEIDLSMKSFESLTIMVEDGIAPAEGASIQLIPVGYESETVTAKLQQKMQGQVIAFFNEPTFNGEYTIVIPQGSFGDIDWIENPENGHANPEITLHYTVTGVSDRTPTTDPVLFTADPASGSVVESLPYVALKIDGGYDAFEVQMSDAVSFNHNGNPYCGVKVSGNDTNIVITPARDITDPGTYDLVFGEYSLIWYKFHEDEDAEIYMNEKPIVLTYTIEGEVLPELSYDVTPEPGTLTELTEVIISLNNDDFIDIDVQIADDIKIYRDGEVFSGLKATDKDTEVIFSLLTPATEAGVYEFVAAPGSLVFYTPDYAPVINEEIRISYRVYAAEPVVYDVEPTGYRPADNSEIDLSMKSFDNLTIMVEEGIAPAEGATIKLIPVGYEEEAIEAKLQQKMQGQVIAFFNEPTFNGEYIIVIPQGSFGDIDWIENPENGHANPEITLHYTVTGVNDRAGVDYSLTATMEHSDNLGKFTLTFPAGTEMKEGASATLANIEARYSQTAMFTAEGDGIFTVEFAQTPEEPGNYVFVVEQGLFGDEEYILSGNKGVANAAIEDVVEYVITGIDSINIEEDANAVYNLQGVKVADTLKNLEPGLYITGGKLVIVK